MPAPTPPPPPPPPPPSLPVWGEVGELLEGLGIYLQFNALPEVQRYAEYLQAVGNGMSAGDKAADEALGGASAVEIAGNIAGMIAGAAIPAARGRTYGSAS